MKNADTWKKLSHRMSAVLRHRANAVGLRMDAAGWVALADLCACLRVSPAEVEAVVAHNNKARFQREDDRIRACQGHSLAGTPVTLEALEASWETYPLDASDISIWHGTRVEAVASIAADGILPGERTHVHLAASTGSRVGKRANVAVLLAVSPARLRDAGFPVFRSPNGVLLARRVPAACIVGIDLATRRAREQAPALRAALGLDRPPARQ